MEILLQFKPKVVSRKIGRKIFTLNIENIGVIYSVELLIKKETSN